ncbi:putative tetratricopeptide-like helical domain superfamily [Helianthus debilis subsp. tardiflorus]
MPELLIEHPTSNPNSGNIPNGNYLPHKDLFGYSSPRSPLSTHSPESDSMDLGVDSPGALDTSIEQLYHNVCEMQSSDQSPSRFSYLSYGHESRIDSELRFLAGGDFMKPAGDVTKEPGVIPNMDEGQKHSLAKFAGCMQLGDAYAMLGNIENSTLCYTAGLEIQRQVLGETDARFGETCRYVAEAHVQAMRFDEAKRLCQMALDIHKSGSPASLEEAADRRLMGLICDSMGDYETALEHYVLASMAMSAGGHDADVAAIDVCIGDAYLALARYDEAIFSYQKALNLFKSTKGENHPSSASVFVRLADVNNKIGKFRESKSYCENALRIYVKPVPGFPKEEIASGLIEVSTIYESMKDLDQALNLLKKALKVYGKAPGQSSTVAGIEAQIGVLYYMMGRYSKSYNSLKAAVAKLRVIGEKKSALFGVALNQMGLACVQINSINEAADLFEEARGILETEYGPHHPDTLGVYSNLAGTYDAMGRWNDAIEILEYVVGMREEKLGTANPDVEDEKRRLAELLDDVGRNRNKKSLSLEYLLDA